MLKTLIVDDDQDMRFLVRMVIQAANQGLQVAGEAASGSEALQAIEADKPNVVVLDYRMPGMSGLETAAEILRKDPSQTIIMFSAYMDSQAIDEAEKLGVRICLPKTDLDRLPEALWQLAPGA